MSKFLLVFSLLFGGSLSAQMAFYIQPSASMKFGVQSIERDWNNNIMAPNKHFQQHFRKIFFNDTHLMLGIRIGMVSKRGSLLSIGLNDDSAPFKEQLNAYGYGDESVSNSLIYSSHRTKTLLFGSSHTRFSFKYEKPFFTSNNNKYTLRSTLGINLIVNPNVAQVDTIAAMFLLNGTLNNGGIHTDQIITSRGFGRYGYGFNIGLGVDFKTREERYLFSLDLYYVLNTRLFKIATFEHYVYDPINNNTYVYEQNVHSRGSGIYMELSRRFQVHPWRPNKKPKTAL